MNLCLRVESLDFVVNFDFFLTFRRQSGLVMSEDNTSSIREEDAKNYEKYKTKITDSLNIHNLMKVDDKHEVKNNSNFSVQFERNAVKSEIVCPHCYKVFRQNKRN